MRCLLLVVLGCVDGSGCVREHDSGILPIPSGTSLRSYPSTSSASRASKPLKLARTLAIRGVPSSSAVTPFERVVDLAVDRQGHILVLDAGACVLHVFDAEGNHVGSLGGRGQGPGELEKPARITVAGSVIVVYDLALAKLVLWDAHEYSHLRDVNVIMARSQFANIEGTTEGNLVARQIVREATGERHEIIGLFSLDGDLIHEYLDVRAKGGANNDGATRDGPPVYLPPRFALGFDDSVLVTSITEYEVLSLTASGGSQWYLRVAWPRETVTVPRAGAAGFRLSTAVAPALMPNGIVADGRGYLYVFPRVRTAQGQMNTLPSQQKRAVDVYNLAGARVFTGHLMGDVWRAAKGDFVYCIESNAEAGEAIVARYRIVTHF